MNENTRRELTPQEYIYKLFEETEDGKLRIKYYPFFDQSYGMNYFVDWNKEDVVTLVNRYDQLTSALKYIAENYELLDDETQRKELLTFDEEYYWNIYIKPFEPFEVDMSVIEELYFRKETDSLDDEENELQERHHDWFVYNSQLRLPSDRWCPSAMINRAKRYETLLRSGAPDIVVNEEGCYLAEEMVLYYHGIKVDRPHFYHFHQAQSGTYSIAYNEIEHGKKETHWMWYIFPQLRGLGKSEMAYMYGLKDLQEAKYYLEDIILKNRLVNMCNSLLHLQTNDPQEVFGALDAMKLRSSMTLFALVSTPDSVFHKVLDKYFNGQLDETTLKLLGMK